MGLFNFGKKKQEPVSEKVKITNIRRTENKIDLLKYPQIKNYIQRLEKSSENNPNIDDEFKKQIPGLIHDVEDFFITGIESRLFTEDIIEKRILPSFEENFTKIEPLPIGSGLYGDSKGNSIQIKATPFHCAANLTSKETRKLYMFHEMGHKILNVGDHSYTNEQDLKFTNDYLETVEKIISSKGRRFKMFRWKV